MLSLHVWSAYCLNVISQKSILFVLWASPPNEHSFKAHIIYYLTPAPVKYLSLCLQSPSMKTLTKIDVRPQHAPNVRNARLWVPKTLEMDLGHTHCYFSHTKSAYHHRRKSISFSTTPSHTRKTRLSGETLSLSLFLLNYPKIWEKKPARFLIVLFLVIYIYNIYIYIYTHIYIYTYILYYIQI